MSAKTIIKLCIAGAVVLAIGWNQGEKARDEYEEAEEGQRWAVITKRVLIFLALSIFLVLVIMAAGESETPYYDPPRRWEEGWW